MADYVVGVCLKCGDTWYRSIRPLEPTDTLAPELFESLVPDVAPPLTSQPPECPVCNERIKLVFAASLQPGVARTHTPKGVPVENVLDTSPAPFGAGLETIFAVNDGEEIKQVGSGKDGSTIILTNKRILRLRG